MSVFGANYSLDYYLLPNFFPFFDSWQPSRQKLGAICRFSFFLLEGYLSQIEGVFAWCYWIAHLSGSQGDLFLTSLSTKSYTTGFLSWPRCWWKRRPADAQKKCNVEMPLILSLVKDKHNEVKTLCLFVCYVESVFTCSLFHSWLNLGFMVREKSMVSQLTSISLGISPNERKSKTAEWPQ